MTLLLSIAGLAVLYPVLLYKGKFTEALILALLAVFTFECVKALDDNDMAVCQLSHSHDVCYGALRK